MAEANIDRDELLLMRHLEGRLSPTDAATLKARLGVEPALRGKLAALELENDLITGAVSVPDDIELPEPVMMAIIDQALKDPKRAPAERRWWKPVLLSMSAAAAVVLAVVSIYMAGNEEKKPGVIVGMVNPTNSSFVSYSGENPNAAAALLASGSQILTGDTIGSAGGTASMQLLTGITLHFDHNTRLRLVEARPHQPVQFVLLSGALLLEYQRPNRSGVPAAPVTAPTAASATEDNAVGVVIRTADGQLQVDVKSGRLLIEPLGAQTAAGKGSDYLVYMPMGSGVASEPAGSGSGRPHQQILSDGTQIRWPSNALFSRTVRRDTLVCDLLTGWQSERPFAPDKWWTQHELRYDGLDRGWPVEWARELVGPQAGAFNSPSFRMQAENLQDTLTASGELMCASNDPEQRAQATAICNRWQEMSNLLEDNSAYQQLDPGHRLTWDMLAFKANLMAYRAARLTSSRLAADQPLRRLDAHLRIIEAQAAKTPDQHLRTIATYLRMESDLLDELVAGNVAARYQGFAAEFPTAVESMALQLKLALLENAGDARVAALNRAWQRCHSFEVHLDNALHEKSAAAAQWRLLEIKAGIFAALADQLYGQGLANEGDELVRTVDYVGLGMVDNNLYRSAGTLLFDKMVNEAINRAEQELAAGHLELVEPTLVMHMPSTLASATLREVDRSNPSYTVEFSTVERWARCYDAWLTATGKTEAQKKFRDQAAAYLPAGTPAVPVPSAPADAVSPAPTQDAKPAAATTGAD